MKTEKEPVAVKYIAAVIDGQKFGPFRDGTSGAKHLGSLTRLKGVHLETTFSEEIQATPPPANAAPKKNYTRTFWMN